MAHRHAAFEKHHHHHHHHEHLEYKRPNSLTTDIGLFALKKLNAMNPDLLSEQHKRLLGSSAPGVITNVMHGGLLISMAGYSTYVWSKLGLIGFVNPRAVLPLGALMGAWVGCNWVANELRDWHFSRDRAAMVKHYSNQYGANYLLDVLQPTFRLPE
jgi:hypothetical protein